jgi:hypothetical protein
VLATGKIHYVDGNAAAIVDDCDGVIDVDDDINFFAIAGESFVDGIVNDFVDEVMQTHLACGADVHCGAKADGLKALEDLDVVASVTVVVAAGGGRTQYFSRHKLPFAMGFVRLRVAEDES